MPDIPVQARHRILKAIQEIQADVQGLRSSTRPMAGYLGLTTPNRPLAGFMTPSQERPIAI
jgi:hypothetical protein